MIEFSSLDENQWHDRDGSLPDADLYFFLPKFCENCDYQQSQYQDLNVFQKPDLGRQLVIHRFSV